MHRLTVEEQLDSLYRESTAKSNSAGRAAEWLKALNIVVMLFITLSGAMISVLATSSYSWKTPALVALGLFISTLKTVSTAFQLEHKALVFKQINVKLRRLARTILMADESNPTVINAELNHFYQQFDDLDVSIFNETAALGKMVSDGSSSQGSRAIQPSPTKEPAEKERAEDEHPLLVSVDR